MGVEIQRIYQQIAVEFQTARANQVYITRNSFVLTHLALIGVGVFFRYAPLYRV
jgi:hypothetical protein